MSKQHLPVTAALTDSHMDRDNVFPSEVTRSAAQLREYGKAARQTTPRKSLGKFIETDRDPVSVIEDENTYRVSELVPLRHSRMAQSLFAFFRGSAGLMARDLALQPMTGTQVVICGDAHIGNFGLYATPERRIVFDLNDFDEAAPGPWEWDVRRLVTSIIIAAKDRKFTESQIEKAATTCSRMYREQLIEFLRLPALDRHVISMDKDLLSPLLPKSSQKMFDKTLQRARKKNSARAITKLMKPDSLGMLRFTENPPIVTHLPLQSHKTVERLFNSYRQTTSPDISLLLSTYTLTDIARRVVGVGSVGTNCFILALTSAEGDGLVLQVKQALTSVIEKNVTPNRTTPPTVLPKTSHGQRVVDQQKILQAFSDPFLGYLSFNADDYYIRQFHDSKGSFDIEAMSFDELTIYGQMCAGMLARAHAQSPWAPWICGYLGKSDSSDMAMVEWSQAYSIQAESDYSAFLSAIQSGRITGTSE